jgi:hypothetical protein
VYSNNITGVVVDENGEPLPYATLKVKNKRIAALCDSTGRFSLNCDKINDTDSIIINYLSYQTKKLQFSQLIQSASKEISLTPKAEILKGIVISPSKRIKVKTNKKGKKHSWAFLKTVLDGETAGECFGYEFHAKNNKTLILDKVGFYYCEGDSMMTEMKFRINVYDMSRVKKSPSRDFIYVLPEPIYFDFALKEHKSGKFEYELPQQVILPKDAMVEIEMLHNLNGELFWFKSNLVGKRTWYKSLTDGEWDRQPFSAPFFIECVEFPSGSI